MALWSGLSYGKGQQTKLLFVCLYLFYLMQQHQPIDPVINFVCPLGSGRPADCMSVQQMWDCPKSAMYTIVQINP